MYYYTKPCSSPYYHDLRDFQDDRTVLTNPHKGWYFHYVDNSMRAPLYRSTIREGDDLRAYPGINHMYLRFDWSDIEEREGVYHWEKLDEIIEHWGKLGYRFAMRLCCYEANRPMVSYPTPKFVFDAGAVGYPVVYTHSRLYPMQTPTYTCMEPDYGDPVFLEKLGNFMEAYGKKYNGHPLIDFVDVGTFGTFGEGHTTSASQPPKQYGWDTLKNHIDLHLRNFPDTFVLINDDMLYHLVEQDAEAGQKLAHYCATHGMGARDDSVYVHSYCEQYGYDTFRTPSLFDLFWRNAPVDLENGHQHLISADMDGGFKLIEALRHSHATYSGFHSDVYTWYAKNPKLHDYAANRMGYWYFIEGYELPDLYEGQDCLITLHLTNRGFAPAYHVYDMKIIARDAEGREYLLNRESPDNRAWFGEQTQRETLHLYTRNLPVGQYLLYIGLFYQNRPVSFAMQAARRDESGYCLLGNMEIQA